MRFRSIRVTSGGASMRAAESFENALKAGSSTSGLEILAFKIDEDVHKRVLFAEDRVGYAVRRSLSQFFENRARQSLVFGRMLDLRGVAHECHLLHRLVLFRNGTRVPHACLKKTAGNVLKMRAEIFFAPAHPSSPGNV